jgi:hypothetical protein
MRIIIIRTFESAEVLMKVVLIGADRLGNIPERLAARGYSIASHISGRAAAHQRSASALPRDTQLMILFTDFLGHNVMKSFRALAQERGVRVLACRRSASALEEQLSRLSPA